MPDDLHRRYQDAHAAHQEHARACTTCTDTSRCSVGTRLYETFTRLQDAYLNRQRQQRR
ncbi:hypothetical protein [Streptomyces sp. NPDC095817]|uniref:hypothetical protein n=1 Tax=Streptomyces sp. NPDC095817 TaxID=3155082 RepID=UPI00331BF9DA